ncbi:hypothetical protein AVEN_164195-1 [Araneus ventricosus]|uniref:Uncharacterized protein n=1 Tax=Araneus ventricosus TaxID=182803 RepID=A0A4Y2JQ38_ARAVE|nr:hypothetical protein AVEN_164195-1 [Araneus ventricosus]
MLKSIVLILIWITSLHKTQSQKLVLVILKKAWTSNLRAKIFSPLEFPQQIFRHQYLRRPHPLKQKRNIYVSALLFLVTISGVLPFFGNIMTNLLSKTSIDYFLFRFQYWKWYVSKDLTSWTVTSASHTTGGKYGAQNIPKEISGPTSYAKRNVRGNVSSSWRLFMDKSMLSHIKKCTEAEAVLNNEENWTVSLEEIDAFIAIIYARGAYG